MKTLTIDQDKCIGCGTCVALVPKVFQLNDDSKAEVTDQMGDTEENINNAIDSCSVQAINWREE
ncbi:MAG: ferredoxin [Candidatus Gottesmanbacteria bacterium]